ncbi:MAG TPA: YMGG-like glycine zipper-containing protein [Opitutaceae bacterium]|nr:YMGG-like glycine zipper-containing protein [Opitutaceae bacterium]
MKTTIALVLALLALAPAQAQIFRPESVGGVVLGGIAGAVIGHNSGSLNHNAWQGAAIGAGTGLLLGSIIGDSRYQNTWAGTQVPVPGAYVYRDAPYYYDDGPVDVYDRPDYAATGTLLGGIAGAIIGNNSRGHNAWRGAAIGAGAGYLLGSIAENNARRREAAAAQVATAHPAPAAPASTPQNVTVINNYYGNTTPAPMAQANALFGR